MPSDDGAGTRVFTIWSTVIVDTMAAYLSDCSSMCPRVIGALQLDDDQRALAVDGQEMDAPPGVLEQPVLLGHDQQVITEHAIR
jgi:hypothetical protein